MSNAAMVALYARVSSEQQTKRGTNESQIAALRERIAADDAQLVDDMCFIHSMTAKSNYGPARRICPSP